MIIPGIGILLQEKVGIGFFRQSSGVSLIFGSRFLNFSPIATPGALSAEQGT